MKQIQEFQKKYGLGADGIIGKNTLNKMIEVFKLNKYELAHVLGQAHQETGGFASTHENLNYSAEVLLDVFKKYFTPSEAKAYARQPERIANRVYANRMGNGNEQSGDGWKYRGRGAIQLTGKNNYKAFGDYLGVDLLNNPDLVATQYYFEAGIFYFKTNKLFNYTKDLSSKTILGISRAVNLGNYNSTATPHGASNRENYTKKYGNMLGI